jgi:putative lipoic acid-binding regulatory protein
MQMILVIIKKRIPCTHWLTKFGDNTKDLERRKINFQILKEEGIGQNKERKNHISSQGKYLSTLHI